MPVGGVDAAGGSHGLVITTSLLRDLCVGWTDLIEALFFAIQPVLSLFGLTLELSGACTVLFGASVVT